MWPKSTEVQVRQGRDRSEHHCTGTEGLPVFRPSFIHLSFLGEGCFKFSPCGMVQAGFPLMSGVRRAAQREAGSSNLDPTLALVVSYPPQVWARFLSVVKMSSLWISQSLCFLAFDCQHLLLTPKMQDSKRRTVVTS